MFSAYAVMERMVKSKPTHPIHRCSVSVYELCSTVLLWYFTNVQVSYLYFPFTVFFLTALHTFLKEQHLQHSIVKLEIICFKLRMAIVSADLAAYSITALFFAAIKILHTSTADAVNKNLQ